MDDVLVDACGEDVAENTANTISFQESHYLETFPILLASDCIRIANKSSSDIVDFVEEKRSQRL